MNSTNHESPVTSHDRRRHLAAAKRWCARQKAAGGRPEKLRCHDQALRHLYLMLGSMPRNPGPGKLL